MNVLTLVDESGFQCRVKAERALWYLESNGGRALTGRHIPPIWATLRGEGRELQTRPQPG
jgi:hypothetical protein